MGITLAVVLVGVGLWLLLPSRAKTSDPAVRPTRHSFRSHHDDVPSLKRLAVVVNPTKLEGDGAQEKAAIASVCTEQGWGEPLFLETEENDVGFGQTRKALEDGVDLICAFGGDGSD